MTWPIQSLTKKSCGSGTASATSPTTGRGCDCTAAPGGRLIAPQDYDTVPHVWWRRATRIEWALLAELCQHPGKLLRHRWLLERVWGLGYAGDVDVLRVFVSQLRKKLEQDPGARSSSRPTRASATAGCCGPPTTWTGPLHSPIA
jgi:hypothetical protein